MVSPPIMQSTIISRAKRIVVTVKNFLWVAWLQRRDTKDETKVHVLPKAWNF